MRHLLKKLNSKTRLLCSHAVSAPSDCSTATYLAAQSTEITQGSFQGSQKRITTQVESSELRRNSVLREILPHPSDTKI